MVRAVFPTPPSPSTTILCGVVNLPAIVGVFVVREAREGLMWPFGRANQGGSLQESSVVCGCVCLCLCVWEGEKL